MILVLKQSHHGSTEFTPAMTESTGVLPGLSPVAGKPVHAAFDGGRLTSDAGVLLLAEIDRRLGVCERLARCIEEPRRLQRSWSFSGNLKSSPGRISCGRIHEMT